MKKRRLRIIDIQMFSDGPKMTKIETADIA